MPESKIKPECYTCPCFASLGCRDCKKLRDQEGYCELRHKDGCTWTTCFLARSEHYSAMRAALEDIAGCREIPENHAVEMCQAMIRTATKTPGKGGVKGDEGDEKAPQP